MTLLFGCAVFVVLGSVSQPTPMVLEHAQALYKALEYEQVIPFAQEVLSREDASPEERVQAYILYGSAIAIVRDPIDAESPFRLLIRLRPDFELPPTAPPKILSVFRKVQVEERALANQVKAVQRSAVVAGLKLLGEPPKAAYGGYPLAFSFRLKDPTNAVESFQIPYRRRGQPSYSSLALVRTEHGDWQGSLGGDFTADQNGFLLEFYLETRDALGPLLVVGQSHHPLTLPVAPGTVLRSRPPPIPRWVFFGSLGATAVAGGTALVLGLVSNSHQQEYARLAASPSLIEGSTLALVARRGESFAMAANLAIGTAVVFAIGTAVMTFFVNWLNVPATLMP